MAQQPAPHGTQNASDLAFWSTAAPTTIATLISALLVLLGLFVKDWLDRRRDRRAALAKAYNTMLTVSVVVMQKSRILRSKAGSRRAKTPDLFDLYDWMARDVTEPLVSAEATIAVSGAGRGPELAEALLLAVTELIEVATSGGDLAGAEKRAGEARQALVDYARC